MSELTPLYPLKLKPTLHVKVWGGRKLRTQMAKELPTDEPYGESWEVHDTATVNNGSLSGQTLNKILNQYGQQLIGTHNDPAAGFPLLVKLIDAEQWLSVQVHPNDVQARELEGDPRGKTEAWLILAADEGAQLVTGVKRGTSREAMAAAIRDNQLEDLLVYEQVRAGDVFFIPANTIHAIGPGILLYEIQQNSNVTYRLYDWGRVGLDGQPRELHVDKGVQVSGVDSLPALTHPTGETVEMVRSDYFVTTRHRLQDDRLEIPTEGRFHALTCIEGALSITHDETTIILSTGDSALIPASLGAYIVLGTGTLLRSTQP